MLETALTINALHDLSPLILKPVYGGRFTSKTLLKQTVNKLQVFLYSVNASTKQCKMKN